MIANEILTSPRTTVVCLKASQMVWGSSLSSFYFLVVVVVFSPLSVIFFLCIRAYSLSVFDSSDWYQNNAQTQCAYHIDKERYKTIESDDRKKKRKKEKRLECIDKPNDVCLRNETIFLNFASNMSLNRFNIIQNRATHHQTEPTVHFDSSHRTN